MNEIMDISQQTPIEIALGVDENGMTTASRLYEFLELNPSNYAKWFRTNILNNKFAEENVDFTRLVLKYESGIRLTKERQDAKLTATFAKKLSMVTKSTKGKQARDYFLKTEEVLKQIAAHRNDELMQLKSQTYDLLIQNKVLVDRISRLEKRQNAIDEKLTHGLSSDERTALAECFTRIGQMLVAAPVKDVAEKKYNDSVDEPLTAKQLEHIRVVIRACVYKQIKVIESEHFKILSDAKSGVQHIIRANVHAVIKDAIGVRHTQTRQSQYRGVLEIINHYAVSEKLIDRIYSYQQRYIR